MDGPILTEDEEKALIGLLYNHVSFGTTLQVFGEAADDTARIDALRGTLEKLLVKYGLIDALAPDVLLLMGIVSRIPKDRLEVWAADDANKHLALRARYYLQKLTV